MSGSVMSAMMRMVPPHRGQVEISISKTRRKRSILKVLILKVRNLKIKCLTNTNLVIIKANQGRYQTIKIYRPLLSSSLAVLLMACGSNSGPPEPVDLLDNTASKREWYCYSEPISGEWRCGSEEDNSQIVPISSLEKDTTPLISKPAQNEKIELSTTNDELQSSKSAAEANKSLNFYSLDEQYIRDHPGENYTIQVMALADKEKLVQFVKDRNLGPILIAHTVSQGSEWHVLLLGTYPHFALAKKALQAWMETNPEYPEPWIRALAPLQDSLVEGINKKKE